MRHLVLIAALLLLPWAAFAEPVRIPGTKVTLDPPTGFALSEHFPGVLDQGRGSSIMVNELAGSVERLVEGLTKENLETRGMTLVTSEEVSLGDRPARLIHVRQTVNGAVFEKWMGATGHDSATVLVVAAYPQALADELRDELRTSVLSVRWSPEDDLDPFEGLPFKIQESRSLKIRNRVQNMLILAEPGTLRTVAEPFAVVATSRSPVVIEDVELFSKQRANQIAQITGLTQILGKPIEIDGRPGYELTAKARDLNTGAPLILYQALVVDGQRYVLTQGMVGEAISEPFLPQFRAIAASLVFR